MLESKGDVTIECPIKPQCTVRETVYSTAVNVIVPTTGVIPVSLTQDEWLHVLYSSACGNSALRLRT